MFNRYLLQKLFERMIHILFYNFQNDFFFSFHFFPFRTYNLMKKGTNNLENFLLKLHTSPPTNFVKIFEQLIKFTIEMSFNPDFENTIALSHATYLPKLSFATCFHLEVHLRDQSFFSLVFMLLFPILAKWSILESRKF